ncbi:hypothetical protein ACL02P_12500 [Paenibacillus sp. MB22_1]|uniref:hypothetical protein n=1 Tax=Paenibacillus sp. MB22_1 TaxID=3383121 RepID=UPI0039A3306C
MQNENEKKFLIEFIKESKIASFNKMNNATYKFGTLLAFFIGSIVYTVNNLPQTPPDLNDYYVASILTNYFIGTVIIVSHIFNICFRRGQTRQNAIKNWNKLESAYMKPVEIAGMIQVVIFILLVIVMTVLCFRLKFHYWEILIQYIPIFYLSFFMLRNLAKGINEDKLRQKPTQVTISLLMLLLSIVLPFYNLPTIIKLIFQHKLIALYSLYFVGCYWAILFIFKVFAYRIIYTWVEDLYNEIHLNNIELDEIKAKLKLEFSSGRNLETMIYTSKFEEDDGIT